MELILFFTHATNNKIQTANSPPVIVLCSPKPTTFSIPQGKESPQSWTAIRGLSYRQKLGCVFYHYSFIDFETNLPEFTRTLDTEFTLVIPGAKGIMVPYSMNRWHWDHWFTSSSVWLFSNSLSYQGIENLLSPLITPSQKFSAGNKAHDAMLVSFVTTLQIYL